MTRQDHLGRLIDHDHPGYFAAFVLDPDGSNIEAVLHGRGIRSAESVIIAIDGSG